MKAIFITGGASGIGRATALLFAKAGWRIGLADVDAAGLAATAALLPAGAVTQHRMDVRDRAAWAHALAAFAATTGGRLDVLFNNAGVAAGGAFATITDAEFDRVVAINFVGSPTARAPPTPICVQRRDHACSTPHPPPQSGARRD